ncbi:hypothetical protein DSO57_1003953 [Entomophthora muscae]|uniref:Uncharacterized protein n=1 Tax=Entomophthora muscae TaxID=34485 RepID=A0ACC2RZB3_9FUNG|nr:hypothetical protein DSO57_1003953 [Entomophthora muscae]
MQSVDPGDISGDVMLHVLQRSWVRKLPLPLSKSLRSLVAQELRKLSKASPSLGPNLGPPPRVVNSGETVKRGLLNQKQAI